MSQTTIQLPPFNYLDKPYSGNFFHVDHDFFFRLNVQPQDKLRNLQESYDQLNQIHENISYELCYQTVIAKFNFYFNNQNHIIVFPVQILEIYDKVHDIKWKLIPIINTITVESMGVYLLLTINVDFSNFFKEINKLFERDKAAFLIH